MDRLIDNEIIVTCGPIDFAVEQKVCLRASVYCSMLFCYWWLETYLGWGFLHLIGVDRHWQNRGCTALSFGLTGPVSALLTLIQGVICAGTAAIIHPHRPVTPYKHPCWCKQGAAQSTPVSTMSLFLTCNPWHVSTIWRRLDSSRSMRV